MKVRDLIKQLLEFDLDADIGISYDGETPTDPEFEWSEVDQAYVDFEG